MKKPNESDLVKACLQLLHLRGIPAWRANAGAGLRPGRGGRMRPIRSNAEGTPDLLAVLPPHGRLLGIECKSPAGRQRPAQAAFQKSVEAAGAIYRIVRSLDDLIAALTQEGITT